MKTATIKYKIKEIATDLDKDNLGIPDIRERTIEKTGAAIEFSMFDLEQNIEELQKYKKEFTAQVDYQRVLAENVERNHPFVKDLKEVELTAAWMYKEATGKFTSYQAKLKEVEATLDGLLEEIEVIKKQIPELAEVYKVKKSKKNGK